MLQENALDILKSGKNVFLTGPAGSGKTYVLNKFIDYLREEDISYATTASTGIASTHLNGTTVHSWSGIGIKNTLNELDIAKFKSNKHLVHNYRTTDVLIIDEISMLHAYQINMIDIIAKRILESELPFGGIQVVVCGDFFQLPPVPDDRIQKVRYAYETGSWKNADFNVCYLSEQHRQVNDPLIDILNSIRSDSVSEKTLELLETRFNKPVSNEDKLTKLYTHNVNVDEINNKELKKIDEETHSFSMYSSGNEYAVEALKKRCLAKEVLHLKVGAKVMFIKNDRQGRYVNGTQGVVIGFAPSGLPIVKTNNGEIPAYTEEWKFEKDDKVVAAITQIPLVLAWAITIHKSQGMTLDSAEIDLSGAFELGMGYVALSRVRGLDGLNIIGMNDIALRVSPKILLQDKIFKEESDEKL
jgi:ATP-dependent DNA helicase PIF1